MILSFPPSLWHVAVHQPILKGMQAQVFHLVGPETMIVFTAPIELKPRDTLLIDVRNGNVEIVQRGGITIWRAAWKN